MTKRWAQYQSSKKVEEGPSPGLCPVGSACEAPAGLPAAGSSLSYSGARRPPQLPVQPPGTDAHIRAWANPGPGWGNHLSWGQATFQPSMFLTPAPCPPGTDPVARLTQPVLSLVAESYLQGHPPSDAWEGVVSPAGHRKSEGREYWKIPGIACMLSARAALTRARGSGLG